MTAETNDLQVRKVEQTRLYEAVIDGRVVGSLAYETVGGKTALTHSYVDPERRNRGVGSALAEFALADTTSTGARPVVYCGFVSDYVSTNPKWSDAVEIPRWGMIPTRNTPPRPEDQKADSVAPQPRPTSESREP